MVAEAPTSAPSQFGIPEEAVTGMEDTRRIAPLGRRTRPWWIGLPLEPEGEAKLPADLTSAEHAITFLPYTGMPQAAIALGLVISPMRSRASTPRSPPPRRPSEPASPFTQEAAGDQKARHPGRS
ncbi:hypothetical protein [Streptomyces sp. A30]|uniref:hypothetical protein n=1 Tax=Streptomyces sp. A30 TaxID=2789273 RepID=UPI0039806CAC